MEERAALDVLFAGWESYQGKFAVAIAGLTDEQMLLRAAPGLRSIGELLAHMIAARAGWFHVELGMGGEEFLPIATWDMSPEERAEASNWRDVDAPSPSADELREALRSTWTLVRNSLDIWTPEQLTETVHSGSPGNERKIFVRGWVVYHVLEHDLHHGGELGLSLGMHGLPAPDL